MPPKNKIMAPMLARENFNKWVPLAFALLSGIEAEHEKEKLIFSMIKRNKSLREKIEKRIKRIAMEKERVLALKEKRALAMEKIGKIEQDYRHAFHDYSSQRRWCDGNDPGDTEEGMEEI